MFTERGSFGGGFPEVWMTRGLCQVFPGVNLG